MTFALLMLVSVSCASPAHQSHVGSGSPHVGRFPSVHKMFGGEWNGLKLGMTKDDARRLLGEPYQINTKEVSVGGEFWCYSPYGYVLFCNDKVSGWQVPNENLAILYRPS